MAWPHSSHNENLISELYNSNDSNASTWFQHRIHQKRDYHPYLHKVSQLSYIRTTFNTKSPERFLRDSNFLQRDVWICKTNLIPVLRVFDFTGETGLWSSLWSLNSEHCLVYLILKISDLFKTYELKIKKNTAKISVKYFPFGPATSTWSSQNAINWFINY